MISFTVFYILLCICFQIIFIGTIIAVLTHFTKLLHFDLMWSRG